MSSTWFEILSAAPHGFCGLVHISDIVFPSMGCRFIALNDGVDTIHKNNEMLVILKNVMNDLYARDTSSKIRAVKQSTFKSGKYVGCYAPIGYRKSPADKHILEIDPVTAPVVLRIFDMRLQGDSFRKIARTLNEEGVPSPRGFYYLKNHAEEFAELLVQKTTKDYERESRNRRQRLQELIARNKEVDRLFERIYEDNVSGKLTDDRFMKMSQRYDEEQQQLKKDIEELQRQCDQEDNRAFCKEQFLKAVRKFMEMKTLTPTILHELVERIDVYQTQGTGKNRTQRIVIHYNFIGILDMPEVEEYPDNVVLDSRQGVAVEYLVGKAG